jgi:hypothetical protein
MHQAAQGSLDDAVHVPVIVAPQQCRRDTFK